MNEEEKYASLDMEAEIFKSLGHEIRRQIIKAIGSEKKLTFTEIKDAVGSNDSSSLSYHLRNLQDFLAQKSGKYFLTKIGLAAFNLLTKTDQSVKLTKYKRKFTYAHLTTIICWAVASILAPLIISFSPHIFITNMLINILLACVSMVNGTVVGILRTRY